MDPSNDPFGYWSGWGVQRKISGKECRGLRVTEEESMDIKEEKSLMVYL